MILDRKQAKEKIIGHVRIILDAYRSYFRQEHDFLLFQAEVLRDMGAISEKEDKKGVE